MKKENERKKKKKVEEEEKKMKSKPNYTGEYSGLKQNYCLYRQVV